MPAHFVLATGKILCRSAKPSWPRLTRSWRAAALLATAATALLESSPARAQTPPAAYATYGDGNYGAAAAGDGADATTGTATTSYPLAFPRARGSVQPMLALRYAHTGGLTDVGVGWSLSLPSIERRGLAGGPPRFDSTDSYTLSGTKLVQICATTSSGNCSTTSGNVAVPSWAFSGWTVYRPEVDSSFVRVYRSPTAGNTWRVQSRNGDILEFGVPTLAVNATPDDPIGGLDYSVGGSVFRWKLVRQADAYIGTSVSNVILYCWRHETAGDVSILTDVFYTPPASGIISDSSQYAHHIRLTYTESVQRRQLHVNAPTWLRAPDQVVQKIDVASKGLGAAREQVRRYYLDYFKINGRQHLRNIKMEGRCSAAEAPQPDERWTTQMLPSGANCPAFGPGTTYTYTPGAPYFDEEGTFNTSGAFQGIGFLANDANGNSSPVASPAFSPFTATMTDVNRDGVADFVLNQKSGGAWQQRVYLNRGATAQFIVAPMSPTTYLDAFADRAGISVFGLWGDRWSAGFLYRGAGTTTTANYPAGVYYQATAPTAASIYDGAPRAFIELTPTGAGWQLTQAPMTLANLPPPHLYGDLDNDGTTDVIYLDEVNLINGRPTTNARTSKKQIGSGAVVGGVVDPFSVQVPTNLRLRTQGNAPRFATLADMDGDGVLDYVTTRDPANELGEWVYLPGRGDGTFGCAAAGASAPPGIEACRQSFRSPGYNDTNASASLYEVNLTAWARAADGRYESTFFNGPVPPDSRHVPMAFHDVTGDGRAEFISAYQDGDTHDITVHVWVNVDGQAMRLTKETLVGVDVHAGANDSQMRMFFGDIDGNGVDDLILCGDNNCVFKSYQGGHPGILQRIEHEGGATTTFEYHNNLAALENEQFDTTGPNPIFNPWPEAGPWQRHAPVTTALVRKIITESNTPFPYNRTIVRDFTYRDPVFDRWRNQLRGFERTRVKQDRLAMDTRFLFEGCLGDDVAARAGGCANPEADPAASYNGLPWLINRSDWTNEVRHSTVVNNYTVMPTTAPGVSFAYINRTDTYLYDTSAFIPSLSTQPYYSPMQASYPLTLWSSSVLLRREQVYDSGANLTRTLDWGWVGVNPDRRIQTDYTWQTSNSPALGLQFRLGSVATSYAAGYGSPPLVSGVDGPTRVVNFTYDASLGRLLTSSQTASSTLPLDRTHQQLGKFTAPEPPATPNGSAVTSTYTYDTFGNIIKWVGPSGECRMVDYSADFKDQPTAQHIKLGSNCSGAELLTSSQYDRGLNVLLQTQAPSGAVHRVDYDAFGRPSNTQSTGADRALHLDTTISYSDPAASTHWARVTRAASDPANESTTWSFSDNFGDPVITFSQADASAGDGADWIAHPEPLRSSRGQPVAWYRPWFFAGNPADYSIINPEGALAYSASYDFMSRRTQTYRASDANFSEQRSYHPLSVDIWDAENLHGDASHLDMYSTVEMDGAGRTRRTTKRTETGSVVTTTDHLATGELVALEQTDTATGQRYRRWLRYDSLGRVVENAEPNSATGYGDTPAAAPSMKAWRYAYDKSGRLVGTRDARGCGKNITYDLAGRELTEDFSPCLGSHADYSPPDAAGDGTEVFNVYDSPEPGQASDYGDPLYLRGKLISVRDRGAHTRFAYDARGRNVAVARRIAKPGATSSALSSRFTNHWFRSSTGFDEVGRVESVRPGADPDLLDLLGTDGTGSINYHYSRRGAIRSIDGSYGTLLESQQLAADGAPIVRTYGDAAHSIANYTYDDERRVVDYHLQTSVPIYTNTLDLIWQSIGYDTVGNVLSISDNRNADLWPDGAKPVPRGMTYDAMYRLSTIAYLHGGDPQMSPFASEEAAADGRPIPRYLASYRVATQTYGYDGLGNVRSAQDDSGTTFDRGLGTVNVGDLSSANASERKPHQLLTANGPTPNGAVVANYDAAGNLVDLAVERDGPCSGPLEKCAQRYVYEWDEVGQLATARRYDYVTLTGEPLFPGLPTANLGYVYSGGDRVVRSAIDGWGTASYSVSALSSVRLNQASFDAVANDYQRDRSTETVYLAGLGRVLYSEAMPVTGWSNTHVFLNFGDHLGSSTVVVDKDSSDIVEYVTYQAYGATDSDYRPPQWQGFREDLRFTGKEDDIEVGLTYFGARYYSPYLARFVSPDPLTIHAMGSDLNPYAYVSGRVFNQTDPLGLLGQEADGGGGGGKPDDGPQHPPQEPPGTDKPKQGTGGTGKGTPPSGPVIVLPAPPPASSVFLGAGALAATARVPFLGVTAARTAGPSIPNDYLDQDIPTGTAGQAAIGLWNASLGAQMVPGLSSILERHATIQDDGDSWTLWLGTGAFHLAGVAFGEEEALLADQLVARTLSRAAVQAGPVVEATELTGIQANKVIGDAAADELADLLRQAGRTVEREVRYQTPIGPRVADLRVSGPDGVVSGLVEVKVGSSPYTVAQRLKDWFIQMRYGHSTNVVRYPKSP